jgi:hypothetical protein
VSSSHRSGSILMDRLLPGKVIPERSRDRQSNCRDDREQTYASRSGKTRGTEHEQDARVANFRLVLERVAFDDHKCDGRCPEAEAHEPAAHATRC